MDRLDLSFPCIILIVRDPGLLRSLPTVLTNIPWNGSHEKKNKCRRTNDCWNH